MAAEQTTETDEGVATPDIESVGEATSTVVATLESLLSDFLTHLPLIAAGIAVLFLTWMVAAVGDRFVRLSFTRIRLRGSLRDLIRQTVYTGLWIGGLLVAAVVVFPGMTPAKVLAVLGLGSIAVGFAFKDIVENFVAGVLILWRFPFEKGDFIECDDVAGAVEETTIRMTAVRQVDGPLVVLPNARLFKAPVRVLTSRPSRRVAIVCGVDYSSDLAAAKRVITEAVENCDSIDRERPIEVFAQGFGASSIDFEVCWWTGSSPRELRQSRDEVIQAIKRSLDEAGIGIPFPHRTLELKDPGLLGERAESSKSLNGRG